MGVSPEDTEDELALYSQTAFSGSYLGWGT